LRKITLEELKIIAGNASRSIDHIYLHWSAGRYGSFFDDYHINIDNDGSIYLSTEDLGQTLAHTWHRNTGAVGVSLACCYEAMANQGHNAEFGDYPPTTQQIEMMSQIVALLATSFNLPISPDTIMTHCEAAELDNYGPSTTCERWDLWFLPDSDGQMKLGGDIIRGKANWYKYNF
jgi:hypothetical protein